MYTVCEHKLALSPYDDKRYLIPNSTDTLPYGHYSLKRKLIDIDIHNAKRFKKDEDIVYVNK